MRVNAFYNIACTGHWREVVLEQFRVLSRAGFPHTVNISFLGSMDDFRFVEEVAFFHSIEIDLIHLEQNLMQFEFPSIRKIQALARSLKDEPSEAVLYFHTKGVSRPGDPGIHWWRWTMNACVLNRWRDCLADLETHDVAGVAWNSHPGHHFCGNFWWARTDYLIKLEDFDKYKDHGNFGWNDNRGEVFRKRYAAELWISQNVVDQVPPRVMSYIDKNISVWSAEWWNSHNGRDHKIVAMEEGC